jgi:galactokinase
VCLAQNYPDVYGARLTGGGFGGDFGGAVVALTRTGASDRVALAVPEYERLSGKHATVLVPATA